MSQQPKKIEDSSVVVFTDGASRGNPGPGGWGAVIVFPTQHGDRHVIELGGRERETTNNRMEMSAFINALSFLLTSEAEQKSIKKEVTIYTDSQYLINGATKWLPAWQKNQWRTKTKQAVANQDLWQEIAKLKEQFTINWRAVGGHIGIGGNERADQIATVFADGEEITLENTTLSEYPIDITSIDHDEKRKLSKKQGSARRGKAYSYVSLVGGTVKTHATWDECKERVEGKKASYRKAMSKEEEEDLIRTFKQKASS